MSIYCSSFSSYFNILPLNQHASHLEQYNMVLGIHLNPTKQPTSITASSTSPISLFDIRLNATYNDNNNDNDVLLLKGPPDESPPVLINGTIVLSVVKPISVKSLSLRLEGTLRMKWDISGHVSNGDVVKRPMRFERRVFEHVWDDIDISLNGSSNDLSYLSQQRRKSVDSAASSLSFLSSLDISKKSNSSTSLVSLGGKSTSSSYKTLPEGNYEFPFSTLLQGSTLESVEGLPAASLVYNLHATIDRGRFSNDITTSKHLRIVRTVTPDSATLVEGVTLANTWPDKVDYTISIPTKAVAIGSATPIQITILPLAKGLKLDDIKITLLEKYTCARTFGGPHNGERSVTAVNVSLQGQDINEDRWEIGTVLEIPPNLAKCTQDVDILSHVAVRHDLKFIIGLINNDGHKSEVRASLPIVLFISPFVALAVKNVDPNEYSASLEDTQPDNEAEAAGEQLSVIFSPDSRLMSTSLSSLRSSVFLDKMAPPNYDAHFYDRLLAETSSVSNAPDLSSIAATPTIYSPLGVASSHHSLLTEQNISVFTDSLERIHLSQSSSSENTNYSSRSSNNNEWNSQQLSRVPPYEVAVKTPPAMECFSPSYEQPPCEESTILQKPKAVRKASSMANSKATSTQYLNNLRRGSSSGSMAVVNNREGVVPGLGARAPGFINGTGSRSTNTGGVSFLPMRYRR